MGLHLRANSRLDFGELAGERFVGALAVDRTLAEDLFARAQLALGATAIERMPFAETPLRSFVFREVVVLHGEALTIAHQHRFTMSSSQNFPFVGGPTGFNLTFAKLGCATHPGKAINAGWPAWRPSRG